MYGRGGAPLECGIRKVRGWYIVKGQNLSVFTG